MATYNQGVLGEFSGKIGPIIGSNWRGKQVIRSLPTKTKKAPSKAQQLQRDKFAYVIKFLNPIKGVLSATFGDNIGAKTPFNNALSYHLKEVVQETANGFTMRYEKLLISKGVLCGIAAAELTTIAPYTLGLQWINNSNQGLAYANDTLLVIAYAPNLDRFVCFLETAFREDTQAVLEFSEDLLGQQMELWASFTNTNKALSATSSYLGSIDL